MAEQRVVVTAGRTKSVLGERFPALASRDFRIFVVGQAASLIGTWIQGTALPLLAYRLTGEALDLGLVGFATFLPLVLFTLPAGALAERCSKRRLVLACQAVMMAQALALGVLAATGALTIGVIIGLSFVLGTANAFDVIARQTMLVELVGKSALPNAIALNATVITVARFVGPVLAVPLAFLTGDAGAFFVNAASYLCVIAGLLVLRTPYAGTGDQARPRDAGGFAEVWAYLRGAREVRALLGMGTVFGFVVMPLPGLVPVFASDVFGRAGDRAADIAARNSALLAALGLGSVVSAVLVSASGKHPRKGLLLLAGQVIFGAALIGFAVTPALAPALALIVLVGFGSVMQIALVNTLVQLSAPDALRSRIISVLILGMQGASPFGALAIGALIQRTSAPAAALASALVCLGVSVALHVRAPAIRRVAFADALGEARRPGRSTNPSEPERLGP